MGVVAALVAAPARQLLRRSWPGTAPRVVACRSPAALHRLLARALVDCVVAAPVPGLLHELVDLRTRFPVIPSIALAPFRADDAYLLQALRRAGLPIVVEGVDDSCAGLLVARHTLSAARADALEVWHEPLGLHEPLQRDVARRVAAAVSPPPRTAPLAAALGVSREHLSRRFAAGGAPTLKQYIDLARVAALAQLLGCPGYAPATVWPVLGFASLAHCRATAARVAGTALERLGAAGIAGVAERFAARRRGTPGGLAG